MSSVNTAKKGPGCLFWGCLTAGILVLGAGGCTAYLLYSVRNFVTTFTAEEPATLPIAEPAPGQVDRIQQQIQDYQTAVESDQPGHLILTAEDINTLIAETPEVAGRAYVNIEGEQLSAEGSIPLDGVPGFSGRYLNGSFVLSLSLENERLLASILDFDIEGQEFPSDLKEQILPELQDIDVLQEMSDPQAVEDLLNAVDRIEVEDGQLILIRE